MDMCVEYLLLKHEDLNSDLYDTCNKLDVSAHCYNDSLGKAETERSWGLAVQPA